MDNYMESIQRTFGYAEQLNEVMERLKRENPDLEEEDIFKLGLVAISTVKDEWCTKFGQDPVKWGKIVQEVREQIDEEGM